jgi:hypothetical protein
MINPSFPSFDRVYFVRAFYGSRRFERAFTDLRRAEKLMFWLIQNTKHGDVRIEDSSGNCVSFVARGNLPKLQNPSLRSAAAVVDSGACAAAATAASEATPLVIRG